MILSSYHLEEEEDVTSGRAMLNGRILYFRCERCHPDPDTRNFKYNFLARIYNIWIHFALKIYLHRVSKVPQSKDILRKKLQYCQWSWKARYLDIWGLAQMSHSLQHIPCFWQRVILNFYSVHMSRRNTFIFQHWSKTQNIFLLLEPRHNETAAAAEPR